MSPQPRLISNSSAPCSRRSGRLAWAAVAGWTALIYATIPFARQLERIFGGLVGGGGFLVIGIGAMLLGLGWTAIRLQRTHQIRSLSQILWLTAVAAAFVGYATQFTAPVEALHYVEYAVLSILVFRALSHRRNDSAVYLLGALVCGLLGTIDEIIQWLTPGRFGDFADIKLNVVAALLVQIAIWKGVAPTSIERRWDRRTLRVAISLAAVWVAMLGLWASVTPARLAVLAGWWPAADTLLENPSVPAEYGHRHVDPEIGILYSRFTLDELLTIDAQRGREAAAILDQFSHPASYPRFLVEYNSGAAPFIHEARVHIYRRNRHREKVAAAEEGSPRQRRAATVAWRENLILERYFPTTLDASRQQLPAGERARLEALALPEMAYESAVSRHLITAVSERQLQWAAATLLLLLGIAHRRLRPPRD